MRRTSLRRRRQWNALGTQCALIGTTGDTLAFSALAAQPPHIVYILADDLGWKDVG